MKITTKGRYALRAVMALCEMSMKNPVSVKRLSEQEGISREFLEQIFFRLRQAGIVEAIRGPGGGFMLAKEPDQITLKALLEASGEKFETSPCLGCNPCRKETGCNARPVWTKLQETIDQYLESRTLREMIGNAPARKNHY